MKFAKQIETAASDLPAHWRPYLIHYKCLKKHIHLIVDELHSQGLFDKLLAKKQGICSGQLSLTYAFKGSANAPDPCIHVTIPDPYSVDQENLPVNVQPALKKLFISASAVSNEPLLLKIQLERDSDFFRFLLDELARATALHDVEQKKFSETVQSLGDELCQMTATNKNDMYTWREIFKLYIEAAIFQDIDMTKDPAKESRKRLEKFKDNLLDRLLESNFVLKESKSILKHFLVINYKLIDFQHFQNLNRMAITKILKKHDKKSGLSATEEFSAFIKGNVVFVDGILLSLCQAVQTKLITIVPQPDEFTCPVCFYLAWKPVRLKCTHLFCARCLIKAKKNNITNCFICRSENAIPEATAGNLDTTLSKFMKLNFPQEIEEKERDNAAERAEMQPVSPEEHFQRMYSRLPYRAQNVRISNTRVPNTRVSNTRVSNTRVSNTRTRHSRRSRHQTSCIIT
ncbi:SPX domain-containing protein [Phycomyces blakesleeanus]